MAEEKKRRGGRLVALAVVVAAALLVVRLAGPGGSPAEKPEGPAPAAPPPAPAPAPAPDATPPPPVPAPRGPALRGRVVSAAGTPVEGARIEALFEMGSGIDPVITSGGPTDAGGEWSLDGAPDSWKGVLLRAVKGPLSAVVDMGEVPGAAEDGMTVDLPLPGAFDVGGLVISAGEGRPLGDMEIVVGARTARSDAHGRFLVEGVPAREPFPDLEVRGPGRRTLHMPLPVDRPLDDLLLRVERE